MTTKLFIRHNRLIDEYYEFQLPNLSEQSYIPTKVIFTEVCGGITDEVTRCISLFLAIYFCSTRCTIDKPDLIPNV